MSSATLNRLIRARSVRRRRPSIVVTLCFVILVGVFLLAVLGPVLAPIDPQRQALESAAQPPSAHHLLGTDNLGRDVLSRLMAGARTAVLGSVMISIGSMVFGAIAGLWAGYHRGRTDSMLMRFVDFTYAMPGLVVVLIVVGVAAGSYWVAVALLIVFSMPTDARLVRAAALHESSLPYVEATRMLGLSNARIVFRHIWPNVLSVALPKVFLTFAFSLVTLSALSFLGVGVSPTMPDWGRILSDSQDYILLNPWAAISATLIIALTAAAANLVGDWLQDVLASRGSGSA